MFNVFTANTLHKLKKNNYQKEDKKKKTIKLLYITVIDPHVFP